MTERRASRSPSRRVAPWAVVALGALTSIAAAGAVVAVERRADRRWDEIAAHLDSRCSAIEGRFSSGRYAGPPAPRPPGVEFVYCGFGIPPPPTPLELEWWRDRVRSSRQGQWFLELGGRRVDLCLTLRQERRWFACDLRAFLDTRAPLDALRRIPLRQALAEVGVPIVFRVRE